MRKFSNIPDRAGERLSLEHVRNAEEGIVGADAFIHRVRLFSNDITRDDIFRVFGKVKFYPRENNKSHHMPQYAHSAYITYKGRKITFYSTPDQPFLPLIMLTITNYKQSILYDLSRKFPSLQMSFAEYAIDVKCKDQKYTSILFYVLRRYMYFRYRGHTTTYGGDFNGSIIDRTENCVYTVWNSKRKENPQNRKPMKDITIYERGDDSAKVGKGWPHEVISKVRIEFHIRPEEFKALGINFVSEFVKDNKFLLVTKNRIDFRIFKKSDLLPKFYHNYRSCDEFGNCESFQQEYFNAKKVLKIKNLCQCTTTAHFMDTIKAFILDTITTSDSHWKRNHIANAPRK